MTDLILLEVCPNCNEHLLVRESQSNDNNKPYLVKYCRCGNYPLQELIKLHDEPEIEHWKGQCRIYRQMINTEQVQKSIVEDKLRRTSLRHDHWKTSCEELRTENIKLATELALSNSVAIEWRDMYYKKVQQAEKEGEA